MAKGVVVKAAATVEVDMEEAVMVEEAMEQEPIGD